MIYKWVMPWMNRFQWIEDLITRSIIAQPLEKFIGDIALYCSTDKKSKYYHVRSKILEGAFEKLKFLIQEGEYSQVILVGHSLGSVIAYDTLARLNKELNIVPNLIASSEKIKGLVTFGSPLDKIAFFFDEQIDKEQLIRAAIVSQLYGFRRVHVDTHTVESGVHSHFGRLKWLNFWTKTDPVSGHLDVYKEVENISMDFSDKIDKGIKGAISSHSLYWTSEEMFQRIFKEFVQL